MIGYCLIASTVALMMNGMKDSFSPVAASNSRRLLARIFAMRVKSISMNDVTCADVRREATIWSLINARILDIGSTRSPAHGSGSGPWNSAAPPGACIDAPGLDTGPLARCSSRSRLVTRPAMPLPLRPVMSTPCSAAILRTSGDDLERSLPSKESAGGAMPLPLPLPCGGRAGAAGADATAAALAAGAAVPADTVAATGAAATGEPAAAVAAMGAPFSVSIRATSVWTATVFPSGTRISASVPAVGDGISASTLSVDISKIGSSRLTSSPTFLSHLESVPSAIDSPICGIVTSTRAIYDLRLVSLIIDTSGSITTPAIIPTSAYDPQLHAGIPSGGLHPRNDPTNFATSTAIIPPPKNPAMAEKQPAPTREPSEGRPEPAGSVLINKLQCAGAHALYPTSAAARSLRGGVNTAAARRPR